MFDITPERKVARRIEWLTGRKARRTRRHRERPRLHDQSALAVENTVMGGPPHPGQVEPGHPGGQHLGDVAQHRRPGPRLRPARQVLHPHRQDQYDVGHASSTLAARCRLHRADLPARPVQSRRESLHRRLSDLARFQLAALVERRAQPALQGQRPRGRSCDHAYGHLQPRQARQLRQRRRCGSAPARRSPRNGSTTWGCLMIGDRQAGGQVGDRNPCTMPYIMAFFLPRRDGDRPKVVPEGAVNFGFLGQLAESHPRDVIFTIEYSVRTAMEAVYTLLDI